MTNFGFEPNEGNLFWYGESEERKQRLTKRIFWAFAIIALAAFALTITGCATIDVPQDDDELVRVIHNQWTDYTLLVYKDPDLSVRHVYRQHGVVEVEFMFVQGGEVTYRKRGGGFKAIVDPELGRLTTYYQNMVKYQPAQARKMKTDI